MVAAKFHYGRQERGYHATGRTGIRAIDQYSMGPAEVARYAAGTPAFPSDVNAFVPTHEATGGMIVDFARNPDEFSLNRWIKVIPVSDLVGYYARFGRDGGLPEEAGRVTDTSAANFAWADDNDAPSGAGFKELFQYVDYRAIRYAFPWRCGYHLGQQASWDIKRQYANMAAQLAMTVRTQLAVTTATTSGNYPTGHTSAVASITGNTGKWDVSTTARQDIRRSIHTAVEQIRLSTLGKVKMKDLRLVMSPGCAHKVGRSQEIVDYLKSQEGSKNVIEGNNFGGEYYDFPGRLYGVEVVIEDAVKATNAKSATRAVSSVLADTTPFICSRPEGLEGTDAKAPNFSTMTIFSYQQEEMSVEEFDEPKHKRTEGRVVDTYTPAFTAGATGYLFTAAVD